MVESKSFVPDPNNFDRGGRTRITIPIDGQAMTETDPSVSIPNEYTEEQNHFDFDERE